MSREVNQDFGCGWVWEEVSSRECVAGEHGHYADFPFFFQDVRRILSFTFLVPSAGPIFCHLCCPVLCYGRGGQRNRNLGIRSIMEGGLLIRVKERSCSRGMEPDSCFFYYTIWTNTAGSVLRARPDPTPVFVRPVVTLLTRSVLTQTSPLRKLFPPSCNFTRIFAHLQILQPRLHFLLCAQAIDGAEKKQQSRTDICSLLH